MTFFTFKPGMCALQRKADTRMVEEFFVEPYDFKSLTVVLFMTFETMFPADGRVKSFIQIYARANFVVTGHAFIIRERLAD
jgi:hypothetical protein